MVQVGEKQYIQKSRFVRNTAQKYTEQDGYLVTVNRRNEIVRVFDVS